MEDAKDLVKWTDEVTSKRAGGKGTREFQSDDPETARKIAEQMMKNVKADEELKKQRDSGTITESQYQ